MKNPVSQTQALLLLGFGEVRRQRQHVLPGPLAKTSGFAHQVGKETERDNPVSQTQALLLLGFGEVRRQKTGPSVSLGRGVSGGGG